MNKKNILLSSAAVLLTIGLGMAQSSTPAHTATPKPGSSMNNSDSKVSEADQHFMDKAALGNMAEVDLGKLAEQNAQSSEVKSFAQRMVTDHTKADDQLKEVAAQQGVTLPAGLNTEFETTRAALAKLHGEAFDKAYMKDMVTDHKKDVAEFQHESTAAQDPALKDWVGTTLPVLESHLQDAEKVAPTVGVAEGKAEKSGKKNTMAADAH